MAAPHHQEKDLPAAAIDGLEPPVVYQRSIPRQIRVLEAKIARLELELNVEMEKIPSCSELLEEIISKPQGSPCSGLREQLHKARAKRHKVFLKHLAAAAGEDHTNAYAPPPAAAAADDVAPPPAADADDVAPPSPPVDDVAPPLAADATDGP
ncbi:hypothetical protein HU200_058100 [Digitaria exilis]|uniref:Uncharacterized protein n=1 Tax=Digitaria exilis TaxID=1010633 RepID=A0A835E2B1_9POAL|nr:hypothetical protein HU200_058100 [Digitaria exilis]